MNIRQLTALQHINAKAAEYLSMLGKLALDAFPFHQPIIMGQGPSSRRAASRCSQSSPIAFSDRMGSPGQEKCVFNQAAGADCVSQRERKPL
jgi:hypothetical protein